MITNTKLMERVNDAMDMKYEGLQWKASEMRSAWVEGRSNEVRSFVEIVLGRISSCDNRKVA